MSCHCPLSGSPLVAGGAAPASNAVSACDAVLVGVTVLLGVVEEPIDVSQAVPPAGVAVVAARTQSQLLTIFPSRSIVFWSSNSGCAAS